MKFGIGKGPLILAASLFSRHCKMPGENKQALMTPFPHHPPKLSQEDRQQLTKFVDSNSPSNLLPFEAMPVIPHAANPLRQLKLGLSIKDAKEAAKTLLVQDRMIKNTSPQIQEIYQRRQDRLRALSAKSPKPRDYLKAMTQTLQSIVKIERLKIYDPLSLGEATHESTKALSKTFHGLHRGRLEAHLERQHIDNDFQMESKTLQIQSEMKEASLKRGERSNLRQNLRDLENTYQKNREMLDDHHRHQLSMASEFNKRIHRASRWAKTSLEVAVPLWLIGKVLRA